MPCTLRKAAVEIQRGVAGLNEYKDMEPDHLLTGDPALKGEVLELVNACPYF